MSVSLADGSFDTWLAAKGSHFRKRMRKVRRDVEAAGGTMRISTAETLSTTSPPSCGCTRPAGRAAASRRSSCASGSSLPSTRRSPPRMLAAGRLRLDLVELDGEPVAAELLAAAGGEATSINGGWDEQHANRRLERLDAAHDRGRVRARRPAVDWGPGDQLFKRRFADGNDPVCWTLLGCPAPACR